MKNDKDSNGTGLTEVDGVSGLVPTSELPHAESGTLLAEYCAASPYVQGYMAYWYGARPECNIPESNPYTVNSENYNEFVKGQSAAMLSAQDSEE